MILVRELAWIGTLTTLPSGSSGGIVVILVSPQITPELKVSIRSDWLYLLLEASSDIVQEMME